MKLFSEDQTPIRVPLPSTVFGREGTLKIYNRFSAMKTKAKKKGIPFHWQGFSDFLKDLEQVIPPDYHPDTHRFQFDLEAKEDGQMIGYRLDTMAVKRPREETLQQRAGKAALEKPGVSMDQDELIRLVANLTTLVFEGYEGSLDDLLKLAIEQ